MNKVLNLSDLLVSNLKKIYYAEQQQRAELDSIKERAASFSLRNVIDTYKKTKEENLNRLKQCFVLLQQEPRPNKNEVADLLIGQCKTNVSHAAESHVADASLISSVQQLNHYNIASYGTVASFARTVNNSKVATLLHDALQDEKSNDNKLSEIAEETINPSAVLVA